MASNFVVRKKQIRFSQLDDDQLLKEVASRNPFKDKMKWAEIAVLLSRDGFSVDSRRARERTQLLVDAHLKETGANLKRSGLDETYTEKHQLLDEVVELKEEEERLKREEEIKEKDKEARGKDLRKRAMEGLKRQSAENGDDIPTPRKKKDRDVIDYLREKSEGEREFRKEELEIRKEEMTLQRERFELEKEERRQRLLIEKEEKNLMFEMLRKCLSK